MNIQDYVVAAGRTLPRLGTLKADLIHMYCGLITETGELVDAIKRKLAYQKEYDLVNVKEELGDTTWYIANLLNVIEADASVLTDFTQGSDQYLGYITLEGDSIFFDGRLGILEAITTCVDIPARVRGLAEHDYILELPVEVIRKTITKDADELFFKVKILCAYFNVSLAECLDLNIKKLQTRYPEKFTTEAANNRNLEAERAVLEQ